MKWKRSFTLDWKAYRAELSGQLAQEQRFIQDAEAGRTGMWRVEPDNGRIDTTAAHVEMSKRTVEVLKGVIAKIDKDHLAD
ncbi:hypothetical protein NKI12_19365 [Mesorhizobium australicum]|uniref:Uncharacterized protein n=1 Tax=Mesorhizobium australicum TaxID=536018 RepID=A0ACC6SZF2_9HYPH